MVQRREMDANLVSAAGFEPTDKQRAIAEALAHRVAGERRLAAANNGHRCTFGWMPADGRVDNAAASDVANGQREVFTTHAVRLQLSDEIRLRSLRFGHYQEAARVFVQPMHDAGAGNAGERWRVVQQSVGERSAPIAA